LISYTYYSNIEEILSFDNQRIDSIPPVRQYSKIRKDSFVALLEKIPNKDVFEPLESENNEMYKIKLRDSTKSKKSFQQIFYNYRPIIDDSLTIEMSIHNLGIDDEAKVDFLEIENEILFSVIQAADLD